MTQGMSASHQTRRTLLARIRETENREAWEEFASIYAPLIYGFCHKRGMQRADAADVAQDVLRDVARSINRFEYDPERSSFRNWLFTLVRNRANKWVRKQARQPVGMGRTTIQRLAEDQSENEIEREWELEYRETTLHWAARLIRSEFKPATWDAFWRSVALQEPISNVAADLGLSVGAVYIARSRVAASLKLRIENMDFDWVERLEVGVKVVGRE